MLASGEWWIDVCGNTCEFIPELSSIDVAYCTIPARETIEFNTVTTPSRCKNDKLDRINKNDRRTPKWTASGKDGSDVSMVDDGDRSNSKGKADWYTHKSGSDCWIQMNFEEGFVAKLSKA